MSTTIPSNQTASSTGDTENQSNPLKKETSLDGNDNNTKMENRDRETVGKELHEAIT